MASYIYALTLKSDVPLEEEDVLSALHYEFANYEDSTGYVQILSFDLEDDEYADS